jgi:hypothetical protein
MSIQQIYFLHTNVMFDLMTGRTNGAAWLEEEEHRATEWETETEAAAYKDFIEPRKNAIRGQVIVSVQKSNVHSNRFVVRIDQFIKGSADA